MDLELKPLDEQVVVIVEACSAIGLATALAASLRGAKLVLAARNAEVVAMIVDTINAAGGKAVAVPMSDVSRDAHESIAEAAVRRFGRVDTWVNDAGTPLSGRLDEMTECESRSMIDANLLTAVNGSLVAVRHLKASAGVVVNIGAEASNACPAQGMYAAAKEALRAFHDALRLEIAADHAAVSVTLVQPSFGSPEPEQVADAILAAATKATPYAKVGTSKIQTLLRSVRSDDDQKYGHAHGTRPSKTLH